MNYELIAFDFAEWLGCAASVKALIEAPATAAALLVTLIRALSTAAASKIMWLVGGGWWTRCMGAAPRKNEKCSVGWDWTRQVQHAARRCHVGRVGFLGHLTENQRWKIS